MRKVKPRLAAFFIRGEHPRVHARCWHRRADSLLARSVGITTANRHHSRKSGTCRLKSEDVAKGSELKNCDSIAALIRKHCAERGKRPTCDSLFQPPDCPVLCCQPSRTGVFRISPTWATSSALRGRQLQ